MHFLINFAIFVLYLVFSNHISRIQMRYFIHFAYKGTPFHGWQKQNNAITVQEVLDEKLSIILTEKIETLAEQIQAYTLNNIMRISILTKLSPKIS